MLHLVPTITPISVNKCALIFTWLSIDYTTCPCYIYKLQLPGIFLGSEIALKKWNRWSRKGIEGVMLLSYTQSLNNNEHVEFVSIKFYDSLLQNNHKTTVVSA